MSNEMTAAEAAETAGRRGKMKAGTRCIFRPNYRFHNPENPWAGKACTVLEEGRLTNTVAFDDFPNCNHREWHNRFGADDDELEPTKL